MSCSSQRVTAFVPNRRMTNPVRNMNLGSVTDTALPSHHCSLAVFFPLKSSPVCPCGLASGLVMPEQLEFFPQWCPVLSRLWFSNTIHLCHLFGALGGTCPCSCACTSLLLTKTHISSYSFLFPSLTQVLDTRKSGITVEQLTSDFLYDYKFHLVWESLKAEFKMHIFSCFFTVIFY